MAALEQTLRPVVLEIMTSEPPSQNCSDCSRASEPEFSAVKAVSLGLVLGSFILFGAVGNILVILSVACHRQLRTVTNYFIVNLAAADLLLSATVLPFSAIFEILDRWVFGRVLCTVWAAADVLCCTASIMSLCVISVDRYIGVSYPLRYPAIVTEKRALWAVVALWVLSFVISVGPLFGWKEPAPEDEAVCKITEEPAYAVFSAVGSFYLPLAVILVMYFRVYVVAHRESRGLKEGHKTEKSDSECVTLRIHKGNAVVTEDDALRSRTHFALRLLKFTRQKKAAKTLGIVVGCFVLCWLPFFLVLPIDTRAFRTLGFHDKHRFRVAPSSLFSTPTLLLRFTYIDCITMSPEAKHTESGSMFPQYRPSDTVFKVTFWLGYFNSCINPIIYPCSNLEFRKAFQSLLGIRCLRTAPRPPLHLSPVQSQGNAHPLTLHLDERRLSPSSVGLSRTPSFRDSREWRGLSGRSAAGRRPVESSGAKVAKLCRKSLRTTCCCRVMAGDGPSSQEPRPVPQPPLGKNLPTIKIHQLSLSENGEPV